MSKKLTICSIVGARPQFVKLQPFSKQLRKYYHEIIIHTGQHYDKNMSETFFQELAIPEPDYNLNIGSTMHGQQTGNMLAKIEQLLIKINPDAVVVFGDTNSTIAGALAAVKLHIPTIHVEAGLRSFNRSMPEEINRVATDHISDFLFAPTEEAMANLKQEGLEKISLLSGDIMVNSLSNAVERSSVKKGLLKSIGLASGKYYLLTLHRPQNVDNQDNLVLILSQLNKLDFPVIFPIHPRTNNILKNDHTARKSFDNIIFIEPQSYLSFIYLQLHSYKILTDSGGIQKEAYILRKPCLTIRSETEWVETVKTGWNRLCTPSDPQLVNIIKDFSPPTEHPEIFGSQVAEKIVNKIKSMING